MALLANGAFVPADTHCPSNLVYLITQDNGMRLIINEANLKEFQKRRKPAGVERPIILPVLVAGEYRVPHLPNNVSLHKPPGGQWLYKITSKQDFSVRHVAGRPGNKDTLLPLGTSSSESCATLPMPHEP